MNPVTMSVYTMDDSLVSFHVLETLVPFYYRVLIDGVPLQANQLVERVEVDGTVMATNARVIYDPETSTLAIGV